MVDMLHSACPFCTHMPCMLHLESNQTEFSLVTAWLKIYFISIFCAYMVFQQEWHLAC